jgi:hypothetical protein
MNPKKKVVKAKETKLQSLLKLLKWDIDSANKTIAAIDELLYGKPKVKKARTQAHSGKTGRFVSAAYEKRHKATTSKIKSKK